MGQNDSSKKWAALFIASFSMLGVQGSVIQVCGFGGRLIPEMGLTTSQFSQLCLVAYLSGAILSIPLGILSDKTSLIKVNSISLIISCIGAVGRIFCVSFVQLYLCNFLIGVGLAALTVNAVKYLMAWFPPEQAGTAMGILIFGCGIGGTAGMATVALFPTTQAAFIGSALVTVICSLVWIIFARLPKGLEIMKDDFKFSAVKEVLKNKELWALAIAMVFVFGGNMAVNSFFVSGLQIGKSASEVTATMYSSAMCIGGLLGSLTLPILLDKVGRYRPFYVIGGIVCGVISALGFQLPVGVGLLITFFLVGFLMGGTGPILKSVPGLIPSVKKENMGTTNGLLTTFLNIGSFLVPSFVIAPLGGSNFNTIFILCAACMVIGGAILLFVPEYGLKAKQKNKV